jgi:hypothetical protein
VRVGRDEGWKEGKTTKEGCEGEWASKGTSRVTDGRRQSSRSPGREVDGRQEVPAVSNEILR